MFQIEDNKNIIKKNEKTKQGDISVKYQRASRKNSNQVQPKLLISCPNPIPIQTIKLVQSLKILEKNNI